MFTNFIFLYSSWVWDRDWYSSTGSICWSRKFARDFSTWNIASPRASQQYTSKVRGSILWATCEASQNWFDYNHIHGTTFRNLGFRYVVFYLILFLFLLTLFSFIAVECETEIDLAQLGQSFITTRETLDTMFQEVIRLSEEIRDEMFALKVEFQQI